MDLRPVLIAIACLVPLAPARGQSPPVTSWLDGFRLPPDRPPRPKPIEPDKPNGGPLRADVASLPPASTEPSPQPAVDPPPAPRVYELVDASGTRCTGTDWPALWMWVQGRNAAMQAQGQPPPILQTRIYRGTIQCVNGACPTR